MIFLITVSARKRVPERTKLFLREFEKFDSIEEIGVDLRKSNPIRLQQEYELSLAEFIVGGQLSLGEIGCLLSHQKVYETMIRGHIPWALILEDDAEVLMSAADLGSLMNFWHEEGYEFVHLSPALGGVVVTKRGSGTGLALTPPIMTNAYWISLQGARHLKTRKGQIGGIADWPLQISNVKTRSVLQEIVGNGGQNNSLISATRNDEASSRESLAYRKFYKLLNSRSLKYVYIACKAYGTFSVLGYLLKYRFYKRLARLHLNSPKGTNKTLFISY